MRKYVAFIMAVDLDQPKDQCPLCNQTVPVRCHHCPVAERFIYWTTDAAELLDLRCEPIPRPL